MHNIRDSTGRPETVREGTNELIGTDPESIEPALKRLFESKWKKGSIPASGMGKRRASGISPDGFIELRKKPSEFQ